MIPPRCLSRHLPITLHSLRCNATKLLVRYRSVRPCRHTRTILPRLVAAHRCASTISARLAQVGGGDRPLPDGVKIYEAMPLTVQKSVFVGRACRLVDPTHVPDILAWIMQQKGVAKAAHPVIYAWRCRVNGLMQQADDDDGETAAGNRLARLLELVEAENVLVVVTRYYGGIKLGPSRFKYISQAARNALDAGNLLEERQKTITARPSKKRK